MKIKLQILALLCSFLLSSACRSQQSYDLLRRGMVSNHIADRGISDRMVLRAMGSVERHLFVPEELRKWSYGDHPLAIGEGQTISQPYIVALMTEQLNLKPGMKVLEIGTGSGYQAAILAEMQCEVYTVEIIEPLSQRARKVLEDIGYRNIRFRIGDGYEGWIEHAPYDAIIVTCAPGDVPEPLKEQLKEGGRMIIPVGGPSVQELVLLTKRNNRIVTQRILPVMFVPMVDPKGKRY